MTINIEALSWSGPLCAFFAAFTWAIAAPQYAQLAKKYSPFTVNYSRAFISFPFLLLTVFFTSGGIISGMKSFSQLTGENIFLYGFSIILSYGIGDFLILKTIHLLGLPSALSLGNSYILWMALIGSVFYQEKLSFIQITGLFMIIGGLVGVVLTVPRASEKNENSLSPFFLKGLLFGFLSSVALALNSVILGKFVHHSASLSVINTLRMFTALVVTGICGKIWYPQQPLRLPLTEIKLFFWIFFLEAYVGSFLFTYGLSHSSLALGSTLVSVSPIISIIMEWLFGWEKVSWIRFLSILTVTLGIFLLAS